MQSTDIKKKSDGFTLDQRDRVWEAPKMVSIAGGNSTQGKAITGGETSTLINRVRLD